MPESHHIVTTHRLVRSVLRSEDFTVEHPFRASRLTLGPTILDTDGPKHARAKKILGSLLSPASVSGYRESFIRPVIRDMWERLRGRPVDVVREFALPIPPQVIFEVLGLPRGVAVEMYERDIRPIAEFISDNRSGHGHVQKACDRLMDFVECHATRNARRELQGLDHVIDSYLEQGMTRQEAISGIVLLLAAGTETTMGAIANLFFFIGEYPESWQSVLERRMPPQTFVEESLRFGAPLAKTVRFAKREPALAPAIDAGRGAVVELCLHAANLNEEAISCPHAWNPDARRGVGVAFGYGMHACIGKALAMAELMEVAEMLVTANFDSSAIRDRVSIEGATFRRPAQLWVNA